MAARDFESAVLARCAAVAREVTPVAQDQREAKVFMLAAMLFQSHFPREAKSFLQVSEQYFATHPGLHNRTNSATVRAQVAPLHD